MDWRKVVSKFRWGKGGADRDRLGPEKWAVLLVCGILLLLLAIPVGGRQNAAQTAGKAAAGRGAMTGAEGSGRENGMFSETGTSEGEDVVEGLFSGRGSSGKNDSGSLTARTGDASIDSQIAYEKQMEERVKEILKKTEGVGDVDVMIVLKSSEEKVLHVDQTKSRTSTEEEDSAGGRRKAMSEEVSGTAVFSESGSEKAPVIEKELRPEIEGIVVSAQGGGNAAVRAEISEAMEALFNIPAHKIKVLKRVD